MYEEQSKFSGNDTMFKNPDMMLKMQYENMKIRFDEIMNENT